MFEQDDQLEIYRLPTYFINSDHSDVIRKAQALTEGSTTVEEKAIQLFYYVRDKYPYSPYHVSFVHHTLKASYVLHKQEPKQAYCIEKSILFAALCRVFRIPNRLVFCNVRNHIGTARFEEVIKTNLMVFHGYNEVYLDGKWVKCTVAFNKALCDKLGVATLEFDGKTDAIFQQYDKRGDAFMEYEHEYGTFHDMPHDLWVSETKRLYPHLFGTDAEEVREFLSRKTN